MPQKQILSQLKMKSNNKFKYFKSELDRAKLDSKSKIQSTISMPSFPGKILILFFMYYLIILMY
jgi:hypothetical protein